VKHQVNHWLAGQGVPSAVSGAKVNVLTSQVALESLQLGDRTAPAVFVEAVRADLDPAALLGGELRVDALAVRGVRVDWRALAGLMRDLDSSRGDGSGDAWQAVGADMAAKSSHIFRPICRNTVSFQNLSLLAFRPFSLQNNFQTLAALKNNKR